MRSLVVIAHDIRSTHNVGSLLRTCEGFVVEHVYFSGYTPYPRTPEDARLPHIAQKLTNQIHKTALGAETLVPWSSVDSVETCLEELRAAGYRIVGLEQSGQSTPLPEYKAPSKIALLLGREVEGINDELLKFCDDIVEIPMFGQKESFNVVQAAAIALYALRFQA